MNTSSRFVVATHILAALAIKKHQPMKSDLLSWSVNTNPVVIRRILGMLRNAGLVITQTGPEGGSRLARSAERITLLDVYQAVEDGSLFHLHYRSPSQDCPVGTNIQHCLGGVVSEAELAMKKVLASKTVADVAGEILVRSGIMEKISSGLTIEKLEQDYTFRSGKLVKRK